MIVRYPNNILMTPTKEVSIFERHKLDSLVNLLFEKNKEHQGVGLAFNQIGGDQSIFVIDYIPKREASTYGDESSYMGVFLNPEIVSHSNETIVIPEACLSLPGVRVNKERWKTIHVRWKDVAGSDHNDEFTGMKAIIFQHELDHLHGKTIINSLPLLKQKMLVEKMKKNNVRSARQRAKEMGISMPKDAQEKIDIYTGKRTSNE